LIADFSLHSTKSAARGKITIWRYAVLKMICKQEAAFTRFVLSYNKVPGAEQDIPKLLNL
jgi:hypothetical protein